MAIVDELIAILGFKMEGEADAKRFNDQLNKTEKNASAVVKRLAAFGAVAGVAVATGMAKMGAAVINTSAKFESYKATLATIEGSEAKAASSFDWITKFATTTPFEVEELTQAFVRLKAYGIDPTDGTLRTLGDAASGMGTSLMSAVEMIADASTGEFERIKAYGIKAKQAGDEVTFSWNKNGKELTKTVKKNSEAMRKFIIDNLGSRFNGAMVRQSKTWNGMVSNLADTWTMFQSKVGDAGFFEATKDRLSRLMDGLGELTDNGTIDRITKAFSGVFVATLDTVEQMAKAVWDVGRAFYAAGDAVVETIAKITGASKGGALAALFGAGVLATPIGRKAAMMAARRLPAVAILLAAEDVLSALRGDESKIGSTEEGAAAIARLQKASAEADKALVSLGKAYEETRTKLLQKVEINFPDISADLERLKTDFEFVDKWAGNVGQKFKLLATDPFSLAIKMLSESLDRVAQAFEAVTSKLQSIAKFVKDPWGVLTSTTSGDVGDFIWDKTGPGSLGVDNPFTDDPEVEGDYGEAGPSSKSPPRTDRTTTPISPPLDQSAQRNTSRPQHPGYQATPPVVVRSDATSPKLPNVSVAAPNITVPSHTRRPDQLGIGASIGDRIVAAVQVVAGKLDTARFALTGDDGSVSARPNQAGGVNVLQDAMAKLAANANNIDAAIARMQPEAAAQAVTNDNRIANDNRTFPSTTSVTVNQTVTGPTAAPGAVARATGNAAAKSANSQKARIAGTPSTSRFAAQ